jgi:ferredoxin
MPTRAPTDAAQVAPVLRLILAQPRPPVARCRLLSSGLGPWHLLNVAEDLRGTRACLGCGACLDVCPLLAREPRRRLRTDARSSLALETLVGEDCDRCGSCVLACPQVDPTIKRHLVQTHFAEGMAELAALAESDELFVLDALLCEGGP